jgi:hypothetical protein
MRGFPKPEWAFHQIGVFLLVLFSNGSHLKEKHKAKTNQVGMSHYHFAFVLFSFFL